MLEPYTLVTHAITTHTIAAKVHSGLHGNPKPAWHAGHPLSCGTTHTGLRRLLRRATASIYHSTGFITLLQKVEAKGGMSPQTYGSIGRMSSTRKISQVPRVPTACHPPKAISVTITSAMLMRM